MRIGCTLISLCLCVVGGSPSPLALVSTLDGTLQAIDDQGEVLWQRPTDQPLIQGTLASMKVYVDDWVYRIIPSLHGHLYMYFERTGDLRPVPVDAAKLLGNSLRFGEDVIAGGVNVETTGIDIVTGEIAYTCTASGCDSRENTIITPSRLAVVRRRSHVLRAVHALTGQQRWNVSVSEHDVEMGEGPSHCPPVPSPWRVQPPDGVITHDNGWSVRLASPIAQVWTFSEEDGVCELPFPSLGDNEHDSPIYLGTFDSEPYIMLSPGERTRLASPLSGHDRMTLERGSDVEKVLRSSNMAVEGESCSPNDAAVYEVTSETPNRGWYLYRQRAALPFIDPLRNQRGTRAIGYNAEASLLATLGQYWLPYGLLWASLVGLTTVATVLLARQWQRTFDDVETTTPPAVITPTVTTDTTTSSSHSQGEWQSRFATDFSPMSLLGQGGFGKVYECRNRFDDIVYAVKRIQVRDTSRGRERVMREVKSLARLDHPNIVRYFQSWVETPPLQWQPSVDEHLLAKFEPTLSEVPSTTYSQSVAVQNDDDSLRRPFVPDSTDGVVFAHSGDISSEVGNDTPSSLDEGSTPRDGESPGRTMFLYIQMQLCSIHTLKDWLVDHTEKRNRSTMLHWFAQVCDAINYVHTEHGLMHRDIKPSNVFFAPNGTVKVGDFGLATLAARPLEDGNAASLDVTSNVGTRLYMSPEQFDEGVSYTNKVDVYALGMVLAELMVPCHTQMQRVALLESIRAGRPNGDIESIDRDDALLIGRMTSLVPSSRPTCRAVLEDDNLQKVMHQLHYTPLSLRDTIVHKS